MSGKGEIQASPAAAGLINIDTLKWAVVLVLVAAGLVGYHYFEQYPAAYRALALVPLCFIAIAVGFTTVNGSSLWRLLRESVVEAKRVIWPTRQEAVQTTLVVFGVVLVMSFILWGLDAVFAKLVSMVIG